MEFREAKLQDLSSVIELFNDDDLGGTREIIGEPVAEVYLKAFDEITQEVNNKIFVIENKGKVIGVMQLIIIPHLSRGGTKRAQIESVRIHRDFQRQGLGRRLMNFALEKAKEAGCGVVQLTTDKTRTSAHEFYSSLGFTDTHVGMKIYI